MRTTTLLEVMAEVGALARHHADVYDKTGPTEALRVLRDHVNAARGKAEHDRREHLTQAAAWAILALHAHDAEAAKAGA
jgi:hypothetical protein